LKLLLDTHVLLWCLDDDARLSTSIRDAVEDRVNEVYVSSLAIVEIALKVRLGKLKIHVPFDQLIATVRGRNDVRELALTFAHARALFSLPLHHRDAFDRMLIAQALVEQMTLATADADIAAYNIPILR
jgi:PIN domain nuclease of toxin-antitoxin system